jgi:hypothetical protein
MSAARSSIFGVVVIVAFFGSVCAQRRWERLPPPRDPQFYEPRNKLEDFDGRMETILVKGRAWAGTLRTQNGAARVEAIEIRDTHNSARATGVVVTITSAEANAPTDIRSFIDYEEIDPLLKALDTIVKADDTVTKLSSFEERYRTRGDFEVMVFKQLAGGVIAAAVEGGFFDRVRLLMGLDDLTKLRWMIAQAKDKLDQAK